MNRIFKAAGFIMLGSLMTLTCVGSGASSAADSTPAVVQAVMPAPAFAETAGLSIPDIAERTIQSVVNISSEKTLHNVREPMGEPFADPFFRRFFGPGYGGPQGPHQPMQEPHERSLGSGVIAASDGIVITNNHVVEKSDQITVTTADGRDFKAKVVGTDPKSDVAVLKLEGDTKGLKPLEFGDSSRLRLGDTVLAIGNPFGVGQTVTMGIVSAKGRADVGIVDYEDFIQTDAAINPGNSGGALVSGEGKLVGINTAILSRSGGSQGVGFAIPSNMVKSIMNSLLTTGKVVRGWLGVAIQDIDSNLADALDLKTTHGVLVSDVTKKSPAEKAGIKRGDVVMKVDGVPIESTGQLRSTIATHGAKAKVTVQLLRDGKEKGMEVELEELPANIGGVGEIERDQGVLGGLHLGGVNDANRDKYDLPRQLNVGVVVTSIEDDSAAEGAGFREGDVITEMNRRVVESVDQFTGMYKQAKGRILLLVYRGGSTMYLVLHKDAK